MSAIIERVLAPITAEATVSNVQYPYTLENPNLDLNDYSTWEHLLDGAGGQTSTGVKVTTKDLLTFGPIMRVLRMLSGDYACSPMRVVRGRSFIEPGDDMVDELHPVDPFTSKAWHPGYSSEQGWARFMWEALLYKGAYIWIQRDSRQSSAVSSRDWGRITGLYHLNPLSVEECIADKSGSIGTAETGRLFVESGETYYEVTLSSGTVVPLAWNEVFVFEYTPAMPLPMLSFLKDQIGLAMAARGFQSKFFEKGGQAGGFLEVPAGMSIKAAQNLQKQIQKKTNPSDWFRMHVLYDGAKFQKVTIDPRIADMTQVDENTARRVADAYEVNPGKMGLPGSQSYNSGESTRVDHVTGTMNHIFAPMAGQARVKFLNPRAQNAKGPEARDFAHDYSKLIETDFSSKCDIALKLRNAAIWNANDALTYLKMKTRSDPEAFLYYNPSSNSREQLLEDKSDDPEDVSSGDTDGSNDEREQDIDSSLRQITAAVHRACNNRSTSNQSMHSLVQHRLGETMSCFDQGISEFAKKYELPVSTTALAQKMYFDALSSFVESGMSALTQRKPKPKDQSRNDRKEVIGAAIEQLIQQTLPAVSTLLLSNGTLLTHGDA